MSELKPCPYCGTKAVLRDAGEVGNPLSIECKTEWCLGHTHLYPRDSKEKLITDWSTRADEQENQALKAMVEVYHEAIKWALGYTNFRQRQPADGAYWWRTELRKRSRFEEELNEQQSLDTLKAEIEDEAVENCIGYILDHYQSYFIAAGLKDIPRKYQLPTNENQIGSKAENPSCFKKRLGVEACTHGCPVSDECYAGGNDND